MDVRAIDLSQASLAELTQRPRSTPALCMAWISCLNRFPFLLNFNQAGVGTGCGGTKGPSSWP